MALVRTLVELHGGSVRAFSAGPGAGSEFVVRLPLLEESSSQKCLVSEEPVTVEGNCPNRGRQRVLVVDDSRDAANSLTLLLQAMGHEVQTVHDGPAALAAARVQRPEVVLLDIGLPHMDGYEVASRLRHQPETQDAFLVAMTGFGQDEDRRRSQEAGFNCHLVKPVDPDHLRQILHHRAVGDR
jgi:CheY-like chemotaxis protein